MGIGFFLLSFTMLTGQSHWGIKAGLTRGLLDEEEHFYRDLQSINDFSLQLKDYEYGLQLGLLYHFMIGKKFFIQAEGLFTQSKFTYSLKDLEDNSIFDKTLNEQFLYLGIPLQLGIHFHPIQIAAGVVPQFPISAEYDIEEEVNIEQEKTSVSLAFTSSIGINVLKTFKIEMRYENSDELLGRNIVLDDDTYDFTSRMSQFILSLSIVF